MENIDGWGQGFDGTTYIIEIASKKKYEMKTYWSPEAQDSTVKYKEQIILFLNCVYNEGGVYGLFDKFCGELPKGVYSDGFMQITIPKRRIFNNY